MVESANEIVNLCASDLMALKFRFYGFIDSPPLCPPVPPSHTHPHPYIAAVPEIVLSILLLLGQNLVLFETPAKTRVKYACPVII